VVKNDMIWISQMWCTLLILLSRRYQNFSEF